MQIEFSSNIRIISRRFSKGYVPAIHKAIQPALKKTADKVRTQARSAVSKATGIPKGKMTMKDTKGEIGSKSFPEVAIVYAKGGTPNLARFATGKLSKGKKNKKTGFTAKGHIKVKTNRKTRTMLRSFIWTRKIKSGNTAATMLRRTGKKRLPIEPLYGPSIIRSFGSDKVMKIMEKTARKEFNLIFKRQILRFMPK